MKQYLILIFTIISLSISLTVPTGNFIRKYYVADEEDQIAAYRKIYQDYKEPFEDIMKFFRNEKYGKMENAFKSLPDILKVTKGKALERINIFSQATGYPKEEILLFSILYEYACTTIVFKTKNKGLIMGRNLDYGHVSGVKSYVWTLEAKKIQHYLSPLAIQIVHTRAGAPYLVGVGAFGYVSYLNGIVIGKYSFSLNH